MSSVKLSSKILKLSKELKKIGFVKESSDLESNFLNFIKTKNQIDFLTKTAADPEPSRGSAAETSLVSSIADAEGRLSLLRGESVQLRQLYTRIIRAIDSGSEISDMLITLGDEVWARGRNGFFMSEKSGRVANTLGIRAELERYTEGLRGRIASLEESIARNQLALTQLSSQRPGATAPEPELSAMEESSSRGATTQPSRSRASETSETPKAAPGKPAKTPEALKVQPRRGMARGLRRAILGETELVRYIRDALPDMSGGTARELAVYISQHPDFSQRGTELGDLIEKFIRNENISTTEMATLGRLNTECQARISAAKAAVAAGRTVERSGSTMGWFGTALLTITGGTLAWWLVDYFRNPNWGWIDEDITFETLKSASANLEGTSVKSAFDNILAKFSAIYDVFDDLIKSVSGQQVKFGKARQVSVAVSQLSQGFSDLRVSAEALPAAVLMPNSKERKAYEYLLAYAGAAQEHIDEFKLRAGKYKEELKTYLNSNYKGSNPKIKEALLKSSTLWSDEDFFALDDLAAKIQTSAQIVPLQESERGLDQAKTITQPSQATAPVDQDTKPKDGDTSELKEKRTLKAMLLKHPDNMKKDRKTKLSPAWIQAKEDLIAASVDKWDDGDLKNAKMLKDFLE